MKTFTDKSYYIPLFNNKIKLLDHCAEINNLNAMEYTLLLGDDIMVVARIIDNKLNEVYLRYINNNIMKLLSVNKNGSSNTYYYENSRIIRNDGVVYNINIGANNAVTIYRQNDNRTYTQGFTDINTLPDILYLVAYYFNNYFDDIKTIKNSKMVEDKIEILKNIIESVNTDTDTTVVKKLKSKQKVVCWN